MSGIGPKILIDGILHDSEPASSGNLAGVGCPDFVEALSPYQILRPTAEFLYPTLNVDRHAVALVVVLHPREDQRNGAQS